MDELRHVQLLLKREEIFNEFQANEIKELNLHLRNESSKVHFYQKFLIFLHMCSMGNKAVSLTPVFFDSLFKNINDKVPTFNFPSPNLVPLFIKVISAFTDDKKLLAKSTIELVTNKPDLLDLLTFSTIPGLFGYLWSSEFSDGFLEFMKELIPLSIPISSSFSRVIYSLPSFKVFFESVMAELINKVSFVNDDESASKFAQEFVIKWNENASFCPNIVKKVLSMVENPSSFLFESFFKPSFNSPRVFGIVPNSLRISNEPTNLILKSLENHLMELWKSIDDVQSPATLPSAEKLSKILPDLGKSALFTTEDLSNLADLVVYAIDLKPDFPVKPNQLEPRSTSNEYQPYTFSLPSVQDSQQTNINNESTNDDDQIELQLRQMLTGVDVIPLAAQSTDSPDMVELLKSQVQLARPDHRLLLEMKIDDFETARKKISTNKTFKDFLDLLKRKFDERQPLRLDKLSKISLYNTEFSQMVQISKGLKKSIETYQNVLKFHLVESWLKEKNPLQTINDNLCTSSTEFVKFFIDIINQWKKWCDDHKYKFNGKIDGSNNNDSLHNNDILHNIVMRELPLDRFLDKNKILIESDKKCHSGLINNKDELLRQNTFDFTSVFQENPRLLEAAQKQLQQAFDAPLPLLKLHYFSEALNTLVFVLTFEGHREVGADQWLPMAILLLVLAAPEKLPSTIRYIEHFVKSFTEDTSINSDIRLINEQTDYTFTMVKSAYMQFVKNIPLEDLSPEN